MMLVGVFFAAFVLLLPWLFPNLETLAGAGAAASAHLDAETSSESGVSRS